MYVEREKVHSMLKCKCRNPNIIARDGSAFFPQEHVNPGIPQGCLFGNVQDSNGTLAKESSE